MKKLSRKTVEEAAEVLNIGIRGDGSLFIIDHSRDVLVPIKGKTKQLDLKALGVQLEPDIPEIDKDDLTDWRNSKFGDVWDHNHKDLRYTITAVGNHSCLGSVTTKSGKFVSVEDQIHMHDHMTLIKRNGKLISGLDPEIEVRS